MHSVLLPQVLILKKNNHALFLTAFLLLVISSTLVNTNHFIYSSLTAYFLFAVLVALFSISVGAFFFLSSNSNIFELSWPTIIYLLLALYSCLHGLMFAKFLNLSHVYIIICGLFFLSSYLFFHHVNSSFIKLLFVGINSLAVGEALWCLLQLTGYIHTGSPFFKVTGTSDNPNVTAMFLMMSLPAVAALFLGESRLKKIAPFSFFLIIVALMLLQCRTAYIGISVASMLMINYKYRVISWLKDKKNRIIAVLIILISLGPLVLLLNKLYDSKKASADGRKLIWKVSLEMVSKKPFFGYGYGMFEREYNLAQTSYIHNNAISKIELENAGFVRTAYNEFLQSTVEGGVLGFILFACLLLSLLVLPVYKMHFDFVTPTSVSDGQNVPTAENQIYLVSAYAGVAAFTAMSTVNFTIQAIPTMCLFITYAGILSAQFSCRSATKQDGVISRLRSPLLMSYSHRLILLSVLVLSGFYLLYNQTIVANANLENKKAADLGVKGQVFPAIQSLKTLNPILDHYETYWSNLGNQWYKVNSYINAINAFKQAKVYTSDPNIYFKTGICYEKLGRYKEAEINYLVAKQLEPSRFLSRYALMKLYMLTQDYKMAEVMAMQILTLKPKKLSKEVKYYKYYASELLYSRNFGRSETPYPVGLRKLDASARTVKHAVNFKLIN